MQESQQMLTSGIDSTYLPGFMQPGVCVYVSVFQAAPILRREELGGDEEGADDSLLFS